MSQLSPLPPNIDLETRTVLKQLTRSHRALSELKGYANMIPNKNILINAILLNEAKDSSEIENIVTTHDEVFKAISIEDYKNPAAKAVVNYRTALWHGYNKVIEKNVITNNVITGIQQQMVLSRAGIRKPHGTGHNNKPGTEFENEEMEQIIHTPPDSEQEIMELLSNLENYINNDEDETDPLVKLALIHAQFEAIQPFYNGNGRTCSILSILYLVLKGLLDSPILYLSKYIIRNQEAYFINLRRVTVEHRWLDWILFFLKGIEEAATETLQLVRGIDAYINETAARIKEELPDIYQRELVDLLISEFYTKNKYLVEGLGVSRRTAYTYLSKLIDKGFLKEKRVGKAKIYFNEGLFELVKNFGTNTKG